MFKKQLLLFLFIILPFLAFSQTAAEMETMLGSGTVSAAKAARFVLDAAELLPQGLSGTDAENAAYDMAKSKGWVKAASGDPLTLKDSALLIMKAFDMKGGLMYSIFGNPRYAYREMVYRKIIFGRTEGSMKVSGPRFLQILSSAMNYTGKDGRI